MNEKLIQLNYKNRTLEVLIRKKRMKTLRLKVDSKGGISLNIPTVCPYYKAVEFIKNKWDWIIKVKTDFELQKPNSCDFKNGSKIHIMGQELIINVISSYHNDVDIDDINLNIYVQESSPEYVKKVFYKWAKNYSYGHLLDMFEVIYASIFKKLKVRKPQLIIKPMTSMWGNCKYNKEIITLNLYLLKTPVECINYVILHELAHMIYHNHGTEFKKFLSDYMPDWKNRKSKLNEYSLEF